MKKTESNREYHASPALNKSRLHNFKDTPQKFKYREEHPKKDNEALIVGGAFHKLVLEPDGFDDEYVVDQGIDKRTNAGKAAWAELIESGKQILTAEQFALVSAMRDAVKANKFASFLSVGDVEQSYYFTDDLTGLECKVRPDCFKIVNGRGRIIDFKSVRSAATEDFIRDAAKCGYDLQAAMYKIGVEKEYGIPCDFVFVAVEKEPPYMINIWEADEPFLRRGGDLFREYLGLYKRCTETGNWFGYLGEFEQINILSLPPWLAKEVE